MDLKQENEQQAEAHAQAAADSPGRRKTSWKSLLSLKTLMSMDVEVAETEEEESVDSRLDDCLRSGWAGALTPGGIRSPFDA